MEGGGWSGWGAWCALGALALLLTLLALLRCSRHRQKRPPPDTSATVLQVHIVREEASRPLSAPPRQQHARLSRHEPPHRVPLVMTRHHGGGNDDEPNQTDKPTNPHDKPSTSTSSDEYKGIPKLPLPEQWLLKKPFDCKYSTTIPRPLAQIELGNELTVQDRTKKFSATRSPSLEKDDKSPFLCSAKSDKSDVFGFDTEAVRKASSGSSSPVEVQEKDGVMAKELPSDLSPSNLRRFRSVSTRLNMCIVTENPLLENQERLEMQNSPRLAECSSAKEKSSVSKFDFSPRLLADSISSPKFFTPPENISPMFFAEPSPKSVYYDSVRSPKFFPDTPRCEAELPQSPRALGDHLNRNNGVTVFEKPTSPRLLSAKPRSPKVHSRNKENYFTFDHTNLSDDCDASRLSPRPKRYGGRNSIEKERFTPPIDKDVRKYRRHNSCDTNYKNVEINITKLDNNADDTNRADVDEFNKDVVDCCAKLESMKLESKSDSPKEQASDHLTPSHCNSAQVRRQRLKSISLDSDNAKIIEQNLGLPIAKQMKDQMNEAYKNQEISTSCHNMDRGDSFDKSTVEKPAFEFEQVQKEPVEEEPKSPDLKLKKGLRQSSDTQSFLDMPRFSPKEFEITVTSEEGATMPAETQIKRKGSKNLRNLTIDLTKRDSDLEKELLEFEKLYTNSEEKKVKTPTLKVKATSLDSSETVNLSLPQKKTLEIPQNSVSVPNTPKRQLKRILAQKKGHEQFSGGKIGYNSLQYTAEQRKMFLKGQDSGIFLRENHANLMLYQPGTSRMGSRTMGSFDENMTDFAENAPEINISGVDMRYHHDTGQSLGSNLQNYKQNLSVSSTNLKTLPEGVPSDDFEPSAEDEKFAKKLHRRNSNQSLMYSFDGKYSTHSLQGSNCSLNSAGASYHNLVTVRNSVSNFSLNTDNRQHKLSLERRDSNASMMVNAEHLTPTTRVICSSNTNLTGETTPAKNCLLQRRGSNNSLSLNLQCSNNNLNRHSSNSSLNKEGKFGQKKGLLERRSSNTSLTLNINTSNPQLSVNRSLSISNYNLNGSTCNLSRYNSNQSIDNPSAEPRKGILERRSSNTSLTLNITAPQEPRDLEIDENMIENKLPHRDQHRKSLSTENLIPKSYKNRTRPVKNSEVNCAGFGSHDNLWSTSYAECSEYPQNLTYVCGDQENEIIYAFGRQIDEQSFPGPGFVRNITTKPLSPQSTSEEFRLYLANMQHLQNASSVLSRQNLRDLNEVFQNGYSKVKCHGSAEGQRCCSGRIKDSTDISMENPQMEIPEVVSQPCSEYQKMLLRGLHQEFWDMPTNFQEKPIVSGSHTKNRYKSILPNEHSRFILQTDAGCNTEGYINANFIKGHEYTKNSYIATQGPLQNTIYDFWHMVHQNCSESQSHQFAEPGPSKTRPPPRVQKVVMLTNFIENNRQKCEKYFPLERNEVIVIESPDAEPGAEEAVHSSFVIKNKGLLRKAGYTIRKLDVRYRERDQISDSDEVVEQSDKVAKQSDKVAEQSDKVAEQSDKVTECDAKPEDSVTVYHYWFHNWADHKCPKDVNALLNLSLDVLKDSVQDFSEDVDERRLEEHCKCGESPKRDSKFVFPPLATAEATPCEVTVNMTSSPLVFTSESHSPPIIVHCSAGIGRTGCLIGILNGIKQLSIEQKVDVLGIVCNMRLNRGGMVQNSEQYELIHKVLCLFEQACLARL